MFIGAIKPVESGKAKDKTLSSVIADCLAKNFTGYVAYRNENAGLSLYVLVIDGNIEACRSRDKDSIHEGGDCIEVALKFLGDREGEVEIFSSDKKIALVDLALFPRSRVEDSTVLLNSLGVAVKPAHEAEKPSIVGGEITPISVPLSELSARKDFISGIKFLDECVDPVILYSLLKRSTLFEYAQGELSLGDILKKVIDIKQREKAIYIYISGSVNGSALRIVYDNNANTLNIELVEEGIAKCGRSAINEVGSSRILNTKIWIVSRPHQPDNLYGFL
ncbi:MAG: hypothetical protein QXK88_02880 [Desulfurococcaceae archaeon]